MKTMKWMVGLLVLVGILALSIHSFATHGDRPATNKAIVLAAFGTTVPEAQKALDHIDSLAKQAFPQVEIRWAYTSKIVRNKLAKQGKVIDSPETALSRLMDEGYTHVAVLPLHTIPGAEFHELYHNVRLFGQMAGGFQQVAVALPLLSSHQDMVQVAKAMLHHVPAQRTADEAVVLMGHGSEHHPSDAIYPAMNQVFQEMDPNVFVGTVEGYPAIDDLLPKLRAREVKKVYLMPLMAVAGDHARNDMAGPDADSWKSILEKNGYTCESILQGTGEYPRVVQVWLDHLHTAYTQLQ
ncbi:sirohydrochlorin cobaltochelatase [Desulfoferrobacter suflitae]|uniref:sirohydrochlorin cobaltochelatase n=1 Tax=Desulfoferrobacter suflitae TaxID=2865782 RepID=UPI0021640A9E|nr:sirohydrochlorin cobaltochelatase [Desulfoferrobacter suflitae]MCK8603638.1 sirohydrochlorin cobaltochelatase [Desulfoferrobacter suflitae]